MKGELTNEKTCCMDTRDGAITGNESGLCNFGYRVEKYFRTNQV